MSNERQQETYTCKSCGHTLIRSYDYEGIMYEHTETGSPFCWDENEKMGEPEEEEIAS
jgi:hypothetical protein